MNFDVSLFPGSEVTEIVRYGPDRPANEGAVIRAAFTLATNSPSLPTLHLGRRPLRSMVGVEPRIIDSRSNHA